MKVRTPRQAYDALIACNKEIGLLRSTLDLLAWDQRINLPADGANYRSEQVEYLSGFVVPQGRLSAVHMTDWSRYPQSWSKRSRKRNRPE